MASPVVTFRGTPKPPGDKYYYKTTIALGNSYPNPAGFVFTPATFGIMQISNIVNIEAINLPAAGTWGYWIVSTYNSDGTIASFALHLAVVSTGVEVANAINVSTASYAITVEGN
ncbi:MAG TPA: hypothetical protein VGJ21_11420 [Terracidiphilus sp.]|jgi:hypothetical protein